MSGLITTHILYEIQISEDIEISFNGYNTCT